MTTFSPAIDSRHISRAPQRVRLLIYIQTFMKAYTNLLRIPSRATKTLYTQRLMKLYPFSIFVWIEAREWRAAEFT